MNAATSADVIGIDSVLGPVIVTLLLLPTINFLWTRRAAQANAAFQSRVTIYREMLEALTRYHEYVKWLPPNMRSDPIAPTDEPIWTEQLELSMRISASTILRVRIKELLEALDESKGQADHYVRERAYADGLPSDTFEREWAAWRQLAHGDKKARADKWAEECLERVKHRIRWELYGWRRPGQLTKLRIRPIAKRISANKTPFLTGGVDKSNPPDGLREEWEATRERLRKLDAGEPADDDGPPAT